MFAQDVTVDLYRAKPPSDRIVIRSPFRIVEPANAARAGNGSDCEVRAKGRQLQIFPIGSNRALSRAHSFTFAPAGRSITLKLGEAQRRYAGTINIQASQPGRLSLHNRVSMRDYVKSVVGSETDPSFVLEALKAQAVCTQTLMTRYKTGDQLTDTTEKQAYLGVDYVRPAVAQAVDAVWGKILTYKQSPATIYFHSTCAGGTSNGEQYFALTPHSAPYLGSVDCTFCKSSPFFKTHLVQIPKSRFEKALGTGVPVVTKTDNQHRPLEIMNGTCRQSGFGYWTKIGQKLGWDKVPGTRFTVEATSNYYALRSTGAGHGVGLCQWGANGQANLGKSYVEILEYYFPGASVGQLK
jgi:stage II sporulation protein D